jgi:diphosphate-dependent phosphofructokinase
MSGFVAKTITGRGIMLSSELKRMEKGNSPFEQHIRKLAVPVCRSFLKNGRITPVTFVAEAKRISTKDGAEVAAIFPKLAALGGNRLLAVKGPVPKGPRGKRVAVLFSGGPAAGGHNVVAGLKKVLGAANTLFGVKAGPKGLLEGKLFEVTADDVDRILNTGGFDFLGSDRTKIKTQEQFEAVRKTCRDYSLDALIIVGGDDSNTNAAFLAELLYEDGVQVIGVPKTIDGDLQVGKLLPISFGFDTATKIYAEMVGNVLQDTPSSRKYWHFIKLMGRAASHVALEVALQTRPAVALISEEVAERQISLLEIIDQIARVVVARAQKGINHGVVLVPEGLIEFVPRMNALFAALDSVLGGRPDLATLTLAQRRDLATSGLDDANLRTYQLLPGFLQSMVLADRDSHGNLPVSQIPTERLLIEMTAARVKDLDPKVKFSTINHFFGYEGRCGAPSLFDAAFTFNLGLTAGSLVLDGRTGYMASVTDFHKGGRPLAIPLTGLINVERRYGKEEMVIEKALVRTDSPAFRFFASRRKAWAESDCFTSPGPRQFWGPTSKQVPILVALNQGYPDLKFTI